MDKSVPRVTVWHHLAEPRDAKQWPLEQICPSVPHTHVRFLYSCEALINTLLQCRLNLSN